MSPLFVLWHLGLGDAIICNGLIRHLAEDKEKKIFIPAYNHNVTSVTYMFRDLGNVAVVPIENDAQAVALADNQFSLKLGQYFKGDFDVNKFDEEFYRQAEVPFEYRWSKFKVLAHTYYQLHNEPYELVHDDPKRGFIIDSKKIGFKIKFPIQNDNIFDNINLIYNAKAVHCINSSFLCLIESLDQIPGQELYFHKYARPTVHPQLRKPWTVL